MGETKVQVNQLCYPDRKALEKYLDALYDAQDQKENGWLQLELERILCERLGSKHAFFTANGTTALLLSLLSLEKKGEVILSSFGHPASVNAVIAAGCTPKFCDIDPVDFCMNPNLLGQIIDNETVAVMPTHIYGNMCNHNALLNITRSVGIRLIYDSSHAFGSMWNGRQLVTCGDISALSLQAFKVFSSLEGGLILTDDDHLAERIYQIRFFGKDRSNNFVGFGLNGKGSDIHAAIALANLENLDSIIEKRKTNFLKYKDALRPNGMFELYQYHEELEPNFAYLPIVFKDQKKSELALSRLSDSGIIARRYFNPSLNKLPFIEKGCKCPVSEGVANRVICIPVHQKVTDHHIVRIAEILNGIDR